MQAFKAQVNRLAERLSELSASSRLFIGSLMIIVVMGLFLVGQYAGGTEKAPLRVRPAALDATKVWLDGEGIKYATDDAGRILVDESDRQVIQVRLATESSVPPSELDWDAMMKDEATSSIWDSPEVQRQRERRFSMTLLKVMVTNLEFVNDAQIAIDEPESAPRSRALILPRHRQHHRVHARRTAERWPGQDHPQSGRFGCLRHGRVQIVTVSDQAGHALRR